MGKYQKCPYCGNESEVGMCAECKPTDIWEPVYVATDINGNDVELTEEEYFAIGEENAAMRYRKRKPNWPWERL